MRTWSLGLLVTLVLAAPVAAQQVQPIDSIPAGTRVWVLDPRAEGTVVGQVDQRLVIQVNPGDTLSLSSGDRLDLYLGKTESYRWHGALLGFTLTTGVALLNMDSPADAEGWGPVPLLGGVAGALIGSWIPRSTWKRVRLAPAVTSP